MKETLKLALEALEIVYVDQPSNHFAKAIAGVKKALSDTNNKQVSWPISGDAAKQIADKLCVSYEVVQLVAREITAIKEALAQPTSSDYALGYSIGFGEGHSAGKTLAQPEQENLKLSNSTELEQPEQEPVGYVQTVIEALYENGDPISVDAAELLQRISAQTKEPEQEPVVRIGYVPEGGFGGGKYFERLVAWKHLPVGAMLYTTPPQRTWVGLTDEEVNELVEHTECEDYYGLVEATEAKLKEKNT